MIEQTNYPDYVVEHLLHLFHAPLDDFIVCGKTAMIRK